MSLTKVKFNTRHLTKGDPFPPFNGKLRLYNMRYCPFAQRIVLALNAKNIDYEIINIDLIDKPEWFASKSVLAKAPTLEVEDGISLNESLVIIDYIENAYPQKPLLSRDPLKKALDKALVETCQPLIHPLLFKLVKAPETITDDLVEAYHKALDLLENRLKQQASKFLNGPDPGYADYMLWPWFERLDLFDEESAQIDGNKYKLLVEYLRRMWQDPFVKEYVVPKENMENFYRAYFHNKKTNFDQLLEE